MSIFESQWETYENEQLGEVLDPEAYEHESWQSSGEAEAEAAEMMEVLGEAYEAPFELNAEFYGEVYEGELLSEEQEAELAGELLEITSEEELEEFLGKLVKGVAKGVGGFIKSPVGKALGGILRNVAKKALPVAAGALGNLVVPGLGGMVGAKLGTMASKMFELELNEMGQEEAEFEVARRYVRLATTAAKHAALAPPSAPPKAVARAAVVAAARRHAPGLARAAGVPPRGPDGRFVPRQGTTGRARPSSVFAAQGPARPGASSGLTLGGAFASQPYAPTPSYSGGWSDDGQPGPRQTGRWYRRGRKIVLLGL